MNKLELNIVFKGINKRDGGEFVNDKNENVKFDEAYVIVFDEPTDKGFTERRLKFPTTNKTLYNKLSPLEPYSKICLICDVTLYSSNAKVLPIDLK